MATIRPFKGFRPKREYAARVAAKPYDVLNSEEARAEAAGNPVSFLHIGKPEIDLPPDVPIYDERVYQKGKATANWKFQIWKFPLCPSGIASNRVVCYDFTA